MSFLNQRRARQLEQAMREEMVALQQRIRVPMTGVGCRRVSVFSPQATKTSTLGMALYVLAEHRGDQALGVDANPDKGKLRMRLCPADAALPQYGLSDLIAALEFDESHPPQERILRTAADLAPALEFTPSRMLRLISNSGARPELVASHTSAQYTRVLQRLSEWFGILGIDIGRSQTDPATAAALGVADHLLVPFEADGTSMNMVLEAQGDLVRMGHGPLVATSTMVVTGQDSASNPDTALAHLTRYADARHRAGEQPLFGDVVIVPYDEAAGSRGQIVWDNLQPGTQLAYTRVAASVAASFAQHPISRVGEPRRGWFTPADPGAPAAPVAGDETPADLGPLGVVRQLRAATDPPASDSDSNGGGRGPTGWLRG